MQVVNPQTQELLDKLYSQILTRTYVNAKGYRIMLSLAYGSDQRGALQAHKIDPDQARANRLQDQFINQLLQAVSAAERKRLSGLGES